MLAVESSQETKDLSDTRDPAQLSVLKALIYNLVGFVLKTSHPVATRKSSFKAAHVQPNIGDHGVYQKRTTDLVEKQTQYLKKLAEGKYL